jgi:hypothetical protein
VGNYVCKEGNCPAQSKHHLLSTWPELIRDIAKFIHFVQFYSMYIHHFELRITPLHELTINHECTKPVAPIWTDAAQQALDDLKGAILSNPCLMHFNHKCIVVIRLGYIVCQPGTHAASKQAMAAYPAGKDFAFITKEPSAVLCPVAFGGRHCHGNEICLHSYLGKSFAGDWAINKN